MHPSFLCKTLFVFCLLLLLPSAHAGLYVDGGLSYRRIDNGSTSENISITDVIVGYRDKINLPLGLGNVKDTYNISGKYRRASYSSTTDNNYTEWTFAGDLRKYLSKRWWVLLSAEYYLLRNEQTSLNTDLDRIALGIENGYRLTPNLLLTQGLRYRNSSFDGTDDNQASYGYSLGAKYDFSDFFSAFVNYSVDEDFVDDLNLLSRDTEFKRTQAGILLGINSNSALRLMYQSIDDGSRSDTVFSSDFVLRY